jgi:hypothetical protein
VRIVDVEYVEQIIEEEIEIPESEPRYAIEEAHDYEQQAIGRQNTARSAFIELSEIFSERARLRI